MCGQKCLEGCNFEATPFTDETGRQSEPRMPSKVFLSARAVLGKGNMKEPGLDDRHRDKSPPKTGQIQQKRGDTLNKNLPTPIPQFSPNAKLSTMRKATGEVSVEDVRQASKRRGK